jgi:hypothetical protein
LGWSFFALSYYYKGSLFKKFELSSSIRYLYSHTTTTGYTYLYDQLNRLLNTRQHVFGAASGSYKGNWSQSNTGTTDNYAETFRYDANGNILQLNRNGNSQHPGGLAMDRLNYTYRDELSTP